MRECHPTIRHNPLVSAELTEDERQLLSAGLAQWGGPANATSELAVAMGFADVPDLLAESSRLSDLLADGRRLSSLDVVRALVATEIAFASDVFGAGVEWATVTGRSDEETIAALRRLQRRLVGETGALFGA